MLFCNKLLNVLFCTRFTWLKRHTVCKTLAVCIGNTSLFQRPAEIFSDREQPRKNFSRAAIPGCRITAPDFLLRKNTLLFQKWQTGSRHWAERDTSSPDCPMTEGNPFHFIFFTGAGAADHAVRIGLLPAFLQIQDVPLFNPGTLRSPVLPAPAMCRYPGALSPVYPVLSHFFCHFRMLQSRAQTAKLPGSAGHQFPDFPAAFRGRPLRLHQPGGAQPLFFHVMTPQLPDIPQTAAEDNAAAVPDLVLSGGRTHRMKTVLDICFPLRNKKPFHIHALMGQEPDFLINAACVCGQTAGSADDPVTGDDNGDGVV